MQQHSSGNTAACLSSVMFSNLKTKCLFGKLYSAPLPLLLIAVSGRLWLSSMAVEGPMENRGGTVRQVVGRRKGT